MGLLEKEVDQLTIGNLNYLSFSAGISRDEHNDQIMKLRSELEVERDRHAVTRPYYRQVVDAYNHEAEEVAESKRE